MRLPGDPRDLMIEKDFRVTFDAAQRRWIMEWKWYGGEPPDSLKTV